MADITKLVAEGKTYLWALRQVHDDPATAKKTLADAGIGVAELLQLKALEPSIARFPAPVVGRRDPRFLPVSIPPERTVFFLPLVTEHGVEAGLEVFPEKLTWTFAHRETQYVTGGDVPVDAVMIDGTLESKIARPGDIIAMAAGTRVTYHSSEEDGRFGHAHIFLLNLPDGENRTFYDAVPFLRLQQLGVVGSPEGLPPLVDVMARTEITDWSQLIAPRPNRSHQLPTWLRNGWSNREATRALDYSEGTKSLIVASPDREPADYLPWGSDVASCRVNPIIAEQTCAVTDCVYPAGYHATYPSTELWTTLRGSAKVALTLAPLHMQAVTLELEAGTVAVIPAGSRITVEEATADLVVRRHAESCARNGHWRMMEQKLIADGTDKEHA